MHEEPVPGGSVEDAVEDDKEDEGAHMGAEEGRGQKAKLPRPG